MATKRKFGVTSNLSGLAAGIMVNSISHSDSTETAQARNEKGQLVDLAVYGGGDEITIDGLVEGDGVAAGTTVNIDGKWYLVTSSSKNESNTAFQTASVNARYAPSCDYWPLSLTSSKDPYTIISSGVNSGYISGTVNSDSGEVKQV